MYMSVLNLRTIGRC